MAGNQVLEVCGLNIVADPHPPGIYVELLNSAAGRAVKARGNDWAKVTKPKDTEVEGVFEGRIFVWTAIDVNGRWIDLETDDELSAVEKAKIVIPNRAKPNFRIFSYIFHQKKHKLYYESKNEFGDTLGPTVARRLFQGLLQTVKRSIAVEVTIIPQSGAVERILELKNLRTLEIKLLLPNPDDVDPDKQAALYEKLRRMNARSLEETLHKSAGKPSLRPDEETKDLARVAAINGYVKGDGGRGDERVQLSTTDTPRRERISLDAGQNLLQRILASASFF